MRSLQVENHNDADNFGTRQQADCSLLGRPESPSESVNVDNQVESCVGRGTQQVQKVHISIILPQPVPKKRGRATSCPPRAARSVASGPWSLEWLSDQHHSEAGVVSYARKVGKKLIRSREQVC